MNIQIIKDFKKILKKKLLENRKIFSQLNTNCYRIYNRQLKDSINCTVDKYDKYIRITNYNDDITTEDKELIIESCFSNLYTPKDKIIWINKKKRVDKSQHEKLSEESIKLDVVEFGNTFEIDLTSRVDTGLFLDQVYARKYISEIAYDKDILNLFSYTGAFSVDAIINGAKSVTSVDLSKTYCNWQRRNYIKNNILESKNPIIEKDVIKYIDEAKKENKKFDIIICDVPSFSNSRKTETVFKVQRDYIELLDKLRYLLNENGIVYFSTNLENFIFNKNKLNGYKIENTTRKFLPDGFTKKSYPLHCYILTKDKFRKIYANNNTEKKYNKNIKKEYKKNSNHTYKKNRKEDFNKVKTNKKRQKVEIKPYSF